MQKHINRVIIGVVVFLLAGCVTVNDVQRATDLIRTDNELTRLLVEVRPDDKAGASAYLIGLGNDAREEADALKGVQGHEADAIAYYRIASTAYWKSGKPEVANELFQTANNGTDLCTELGEKAPDRDCLFLRLVIPFAGLESLAGEKGLSGMMDGVDFGDGEATAAEISAMKDIHGSLSQAKTMVGKILIIGRDDRLLTHPSMQDYYCRNVRLAKDYYNPTVSVFVTKVREYGDNVGDVELDLEVTVEEARALKVKGGVPGFCPEE
jgi:hypothetical protein